MLWFLGELTLYRLLKCPVKKSKFWTSICGVSEVQPLPPHPLALWQRPRPLIAGSRRRPTHSVCPQHHSCHGNPACVCGFFARVCALLLGIGCWGRDAFQSNLLLGCGSPPPPRVEERGCRWRSLVLMMFGQHSAPCHCHHIAALQGKY